jgi:hypothetical protein
VQRSAFEEMSVSILQFGQAYNISSNEHLSMKIYSVTSEIDRASAQTLNLLCASGGNKLVTQTRLNAWIER